MTATAHGRSPAGVPVAYADLPLVPGTSERHAWDVWGRDDELGRLNLVGPDEVRYACGLVRTGTVVPLGLPLDEPRPGLIATRETYRHTVVVGRGGRDEHLDGFYPQASSQWDGLRHVRFREHGYWGGRQDDDLDHSDVLGIDRWAAHGMVGRGVLVDVAAHFARRGEPLVPDRRFGVTPGLIDEVLREQAVSLRPGDFLLLRTGWLEWFRALAEPDRRALVGSVGRPGSPLECPGLDPGRDTVEYLWDHGTVAVAADNIAVEVLPMSAQAGVLHRRAIPLLGMAFGELWALAELSARCAEAGRYEFLLTSTPLALPRGVGSPAGALAVL